MHSNWNPWHGCIKCSEGCQNCYVYYLDRMRGKSGADVYKTKTGFRYPLSKDRSGQYKIQSGEMISVCMTSDFFLEEADEWRAEAWEMMHNEQAFRSGMIYQGKEMQFDLKDRFGQPVSKETLYVPRYAKKCSGCFL